MKEEANEINNTLNEMHGEAKQYVLEESVENENNQIDV